MHQGAQPSSKHPSLHKMTPAPLVAVRALAAKGVERIGLSSLCSRHKRFHRREHFLSPAGKPGRCAPAQAMASRMHRASLQCEQECTLRMSSPPQ